MAERPISDYPEWFTDTPDVQSATIDENFNRLFGNDPDFLNADPATQANIRQAHLQLVQEAALKSKHNPSKFEAARNQAQTDEGTFLGNFTRTLKRSHEDTLRRGLMLDDVVPGNQLDADFAAQAVKYFEKRTEAPMTAERKQLAQDMAKWQKNTEHGTFWDKTKATGTLVKDIVTNPGGVMDVAAESAASMSVIGAGAAAGSAVGAGVTAVTGGLAAPIAPAFTAAGMWGAETADAASSKFMEKLQGRLQEAGIAPTESNIQMFLDKNPELVEQDKQDALKYGGVLGAVDVALGGFFSKLATLPTRAARKAALASAEAAPARAMLAEAAQATGKPIEELTEDYVNRLAADALGARTFKQKLGTAGTAYVGEIASEPTSEAIATASIGEENTAENLIYETLGGIGAGPYGAAINTAALGTKLAANKTGEFTQKLLASTPETKATVAAQEQAFEQAKQQSRAAAEFAYKKTVAETAPDDTRVDDWANPEHPDYNPIKAVAVLAKAQDTDVTALDKARAVANNMMVEIQNIDAEMAMVEEKQKEAQAAGDKGKVLLLGDELKRLSDTIEYKAATRQKVMTQVDLMKNKAIAAAQTKDIKPIDIETATPEEITDHITESIGSHGNKNAAKNEDIQALLKRQDITTEQRTLLSDTLKANVARQQVEETAKSSKSMVDVANDIYRGMQGSEFKGIDSYMQGITYYLQKGDTESATKQLEGLKRFRDAHQTKAEQTKDLFETYKKKATEARNYAIEEIYSPEQQKVYRSMQKENPKFYVANETIKLVTAEAQEVAALNAEVTRAESLMKLKTAPTPATESQIAESILPESPAIEEPVQETPNLPEEALVVPDYSQAKDDVLQRFLDKANTVISAGGSLTPEQQQKFNAITQVMEQRAKDAPTPQEELNQIEQELIAVVSPPGVTGKQMSLDFSTQQEGDQTNGQVQGQQEEEEVNPADFSEADLAAIDIQDLESNAAGSDKIVIDGHVKNASYSPNSVQGRWYLDEGYSTAEVVAALRVISEGRTPRKNAVRQRAIIELWRRRQEDIRQEFGIQPQVEEDNADTNQEIVVEEEINPSTLDSNTDSFTSIEDLDLDTLMVTFTDTDGTEQIKPYRDAAQDLQTRTTEATEILKCFQN